MGRAKLKMEYIMKEKSRHLTFKKRKEGLVKKIKEFTTLCDVSACMIIYGPDQDCSTQPPLVWPENIEEAKRVIEIYKSKNKDGENRAIGLTDFIKDRSKKIEEEVSKLHGASYFTSVDFMDDIAERDLRVFASELNDKLLFVYSKIDDLMKLNANGFLLQAAAAAAPEAMNGIFLQPYGNGGGGSHRQCLVQRGVALDLIDYQQQQQQQQQEAIFGFNPLEMPFQQQNHHHHHHQSSLMNQNMMMLKNEILNIDSVQFGGLSNSINNVHYGASYAHQVYCESSSSSSCHDVNNNNVVFDGSPYLPRYISAMQQQQQPVPMPPPFVPSAAAVMANMVRGVLPPPVSTFQDNFNGADHHYRNNDSAV